MFNFWPFKKKSIHAGGSIATGDLLSPASLKGEITLKTTYDVREVQAQYGQEVADILRQARQNVFGRSYIGETQDGRVVKVVN